MKKVLLFVGLSLVFVTPFANAQGFDPEATLRSLILGESDEPISAFAAAIVCGSVAAQCSSDKEGKACNLGGGLTGTCISGQESCRCR